MDGSTSGTSVANALCDRALDRPNHIAVHTPSCSVTFEELAGRTANLATSILDMGDGDAWLPVFVDRSIDSIVAVLAAIHAGSAFVPIDIGLPQARIQQLLSRADHPKIAVVARPEMRDMLPSEIRAVPLNANHQSTSPPQDVEP